MGSSAPQQVPPPPRDPWPLRPPPVAGSRRGTGGRLRRSRDDRMVAGVCAGVARSVGVDPTWVRLAVVGLTLFGGGAGLLLYAVGWIVMPEEPEPPAYVPLGSDDDGGWSAAGATAGTWVPVTPRRSGVGGAALGGLLIAAGAALWLLLAGLPALAGPVALMTVGVAVALAGFRR